MARPIFGEDVASNRFVRKSGRKIGRKLDQSVLKSLRFVLVFGKKPISLVYGKKRSFKSLGVKKII